MHAAKSVCSACPVSVACLGRAILDQEAEGIWGGYTPLERRALLCDVDRLGRSVAPVVRRLERGVTCRARPVDYVPIVHQLTRRGWSLERLSIALGIAPQDVVKVRQRALAAQACLAAVQDAAEQPGMAA